MANCAQGNHVSLTGLTMPADPSLYKDREQTYIKHLFLTKYLQELSYKTLQGRSNVFNFVDAFAGPWKISDKADYSDASFHQAVKTLTDVRGHLYSLGKRDIKIRFCFCEKRADRVEELKAFAEKKERLEIHVFQGLFEDNLDNIDEACHDGFTFTFIDPTGWDIRSHDIFEFLKKKNGEFLLNFMSEDINRHAEYSQVAESYGRFVADPDWEDDFKALPDDLSNEEKILIILKKRMKAAKIAKFLPNIPIKKPRENRIKMRLILGTHNKNGLELFRNVQEKVEKEEMSTRNKIKEESSGARSLFTDDEITAMEQKALGVGCSKHCHEADALILKVLEKHPNVQFQKLSNFVLERLPLKATHVKAVLKEMKNRGDISYDLPSKRHKPQPNTTISKTSFAHDNI